MSASIAVVGACRPFIASLLSGQYERPLKIVAFNTQEGWARDVMAEIAAAITGRIYDSDELTPALRDFIDRAVPPCPRGDFLVDTSLGDRA